MVAIQDQKNKFLDNSTFGILKIIKCCFIFKQTANFIDDYH